MLRFGLRSPRTGTPWRALDVTPWDQWCIGVILGVGEPLEQVSVDTHFAWSCAETLPYDLMRWNNPQNTTEKWPGSRDSGAQPGTRDVQIYASVQDGIDATCFTLLNEPYYSAIVANLRAGLPRQQWGLYSTAATELHAWGTGSAWLLHDFGPAPAIGGDMISQDTINRINAQYDGMFGDPATNAYAKLYWQRVAAAVVQVGGGTLTPAQAQELQEAHDAVLKIEAALKGA